MRPRGYITGSTRGIRRRIVAILIAAAALIAVAAPASAQALGLSGLIAEPANTEAGAHSNFNIHIGFTSASNDVKNLTIALPPGLVGDPNATPFCSVAQLDADACPSNTKVGTASSNVTLLSLIPNPLPVSGDIYNVQAHPGEPARFGIVLRALPINVPLGLVLPPIVLQSGVELRQGDFGLNTVIKDIPNSATVLDLGVPVSIPIDITAMNVTLNGVAGGKPFMRNPTSCAPAVTNFTAVPYSGSTATGHASFTPTNCGSLDFSPTLAVNINSPSHAVGARPDLSTAIDQGPDEAGLKDAKVFIPPDIGVDINRLTAPGCAPSDFAAGACPPSTIVGSALAASPLLSQPLTGPVALVANPAGGLPVIGLDLQGQLHLQLTGVLGLDKTTTFTGLPDIPIAHFALSFTGGPNGLLTTSRDICAPPPPVFHADFAGHNGAMTSVDSAASVTCGSGGAVRGKCAKAKKKHKKHRAAEAKKHKKKSCKKKKKHKKRL